MKFYQFKIFKPFDNIIQHAFFTRKTPASEQKTIREFFRVPIIYETEQIHRAEVWDLSNSSEKILADAIITNRPGCAIMVKVADCMPIFIYDPKNRAIGLAHSGWKGTLKNIIGNTIHEMQKKYNTDPCEIFVGIGPSIGPCCYTRPKWKDEIPESFHKYMKDDHLDLWKIAEDQLTDLGVPLSHIENMFLCTKCHNDIFSSYRVEKENTKNLAAVMKKN